MNKKPLFLAMALAGAVGSAAAAGPAIDFSGYMRAGVGLNARGGNQVCYQLAGADTKWRLGNECDYVVEPNINAKLAEFEGSDWHVHVMPSVYKAWSDGQSQPDALTTRFGQIYTYGDHVSQLANGKIWAGRRFYNRLQLGINDQFLENNDGNGAGVEDMDLGVGKLSVAFMMDPNYGVPGAVNDTSVKNNRFSIPVRLTGIKDLPNGDLSIYVTGSMQSKTGGANGQEAAKQPKGLAIGAYQTLNGTLGGATLIGAKFDKLGETKNSRVVVQQTGKLGEATGWDVIAEYRINKQVNEGGNKWFSLGGRADTYLGGPFRALVELGHDQVKPDSGSGLAAAAGSTGNLTMTKVTAALAASAGKDPWSRPTVRLFVTHAVWNEAARLNLGGTTQAVFGDKKAGTSIGIQGETWW